MNKQQIIFEAETFCAVLSYLMWIKKLTDRNSTLYVDNEGTKFCLMKGFSENAAVDLLCGIFCELEVSAETSCWLSRVPSHSNIADMPSRGIVHELLDAGYIDDSKLATAMIQQLFTFLELKVGQRAECSLVVPRC